MLSHLLVAIFLVSLAHSSEYVYLENRHSSTNMLLAAGYYWPSGLIGKCTAAVYLHTYQKHVDRESSFYTNPNVDSQYPQPTTHTYSGSGYDRGHMGAAADFNYEEEAEYQSFYVTNISPQDSWTNQQPWRIVEESVRNYAHNTATDLYIITCTHGQYSSYNGLAIASHYYKLVCQYNKEGTAPMVAFKADNTKTTTTEEREARKQDTLIARDAKALMAEIGETFNAPSEFSRSFEDVSAACSEYLPYNAADWPGLEESLASRASEVHVD